MMTKLISEMSYQAIENLKGDFASVLKAYARFAIAPFDCGSEPVTDWEWQQADNGAVFLLPSTLDDIEALDVTGSGMFSDAMPSYDFGLVATYLALTYVNAAGLFKEEVDKAKVLFIDFLVSTGDVEYIAGVADAFLKIGQYSNPAIIEMVGHRIMMSRNPDYNTRVRDNALSLTVRTQEEIEEESNVIIFDDYLQVA